MSEIEFIIKLFKFLKYEFIDEIVMGQKNKLFYRVEKNIVSIWFDFNSGEVSSILISKDDVRLKLGQGETIFFGNLSNFINIHQDNIREFNLQELNI